MFLRLVFAVAVLGLLPVLLADPPSGFDEAQRLQRTLLVAGLLVTSVGMVVPWSRWIPLVAPGRNLAVLSKLLGWAGASGVAFALAKGSVLGVLACVLVTVSAIALWQRRAWAAWPWYAIAAGCFVASAAGMVRAVSAFRVAVQDPNSAGRATGSVLGIAAWAALGVLLMSEITAWRRGLRSSGDASAAPPGGTA
jgi:hypothetical protein